MGQTEKQIREAEQETLKKSQRVLEELVRYHQNNNAYSRGQVKELAANLQDLQYWINQLISAKKSIDRANPTSERLAEIKRWGKIIQPFNEHLAEVALTPSEDSLYQSLSSESLGLLNYSLPNEALKKAVTSKLDETQNLNMSRRAAEILFEHRIFDEEHRDLLIEKGRNLRGKSKIEWMGSLSSFGVKSDVQKIVDYLNSLEFSGDNSIKHMKDVRSVFRAMNSLGKDAQKLKEPLNRILKIFEEKAPEYASRIQETIDWIDSSEPKKRKYARNGSGYLDEPIDWDAVGTVQNVERPKSSGGQKSLLTNKNEGDPRLPEREISETEQSPSRLPWIIAGVLLAGILLLLLKTFKGKSTS